MAREVDPDLDEGVYVQFRGPHYETPAEVQMAKTIGGDLVGMSTTLEAIAARQAGMEVLGISLVTNLAAGISDQPLSHAEVIEAGQAAAERCGRLLAAVVAEDLRGHRHDVCRAARSCRRRPPQPPTARAQSCSTWPRPGSTTTPTPRPGSSSAR